MLEDLYILTREMLAGNASRRTVHTARRIEDAAFCRQFTTVSLASDYRVLLAFVLERALAGIPSTGEALDVGCGPGVLLGEFARRRPGMAFTGVDLSSAMLGEARVHLDRTGIGNVSLLQGDMRHLPALLGQRRFDWITWTFGLHYGGTEAETVGVLDALAGLLKPDGVFFLADLARFKREDTRQWFLKTYDRGYGDQYYAEVEESYAAAFDHTELTDLVRRSRLHQASVEWSRWVPMLQIARAGKLVARRDKWVRMDLPWKQGAKLSALRCAYDATAVKHPITSARSSPAPTLDIGHVDLSRVTTTV